MTDNISNVLIIDNSKCLKQYKALLEKELPLTTYYSDNRGHTVNLLNKYSFATIIIEADRVIDLEQFFRDAQNAYLNEKIPLIIISSLDFNHLPTGEDIRSGVIDYLSKPINEFLLVNKLRLFLNIEKHQIELSSKKDIRLLKIQHTIEYLSTLQKKPKNIFENILDSVFELDWVDSGGIYLLDQLSHDLRLIKFKGLTKKFVELTKFYPAASPQVKLILNKTPFYDLFQNLIRVLGTEVPEVDLKVIAVVPLVYDNRVIGALNVASKVKNELTEIDKNGIEELASRISTLIVYAQTQEELKKYQRELEEKIKKRSEVLYEAQQKLEKEIEIHMKTKSALSATKNKYKSVFENAQDGIVLFDAETLKLVEINRKAYEDLGYTYDEIKRLSYKDFSIYQNEQERDLVMEKLFSEGHIKIQTKHRKKNGDISYRVINASILELNGKKYIQGIIHDITGLMKKEIDLANSEKKYRDLQSNLPIGMWITNMEGYFLYVNKAVVNMLGYESEEELLMLQVAEIHYDKKLRLKLIEQVRETGFLKREVVRFIRKDKSLFWGAMSVKGIKNAEGDLIQFDGTMEDVSEMKNAQIKLEEAHKEIKIINKNLEDRVESALYDQQQQQQFILQKSKIESLGELAAGIAHEINQPLGIMSLSLENLHYKISANKVTPEYVANKFESIKSNISRIRKIVDHIRTFSRDSDSLSIEKLDVNNAINNSLLLIGAQYRNHNIDIRLNLEENIGFSIGSKLKFEQVILNLLSNAKHAIEEMDMITDSDYSKIIRISTNADGKMISILVEDNGIGITPENLTKVFAPFYTSKPVGVGTGLGLSIVYGIINEMKGEVSIDSKRNKFTKVKILLPRFPKNV
jgi:PAS domain S-box-containing protein